MLLVFLPGLFVWAVLGTTQAHMCRGMRNECGLEGTGGPERRVYETQQGHSQIAGRNRL